LIILVPGRRTARSRWHPGQSIQLKSAGASSSRRFGWPPRCFGAHAGGWSRRTGKPGWHRWKIPWAAAEWVAGEKYSILYMTHYKYFICETLRYCGCRHLCFGGMAVPGLAAK